MSAGMDEATRSMHPQQQPMVAPHTLPAIDVAAQLQSSANRGLTDEQVRTRQEGHGTNVLIKAVEAPLWRKLIRQFASVLVGILIAAAIISGAMGEWTETVAILAIVVLNGVIGFLQEERAERALASLRKLAAPTCRVTREGREQSVPAAQLVPGDIVQIEAGDQVPADARLLEAFRLSTQEAALTGESTPVWKDAAAVLTGDTALADRGNMLLAGTSVATGKGRAIVVATGMSTELGRIAGMLERTERERTPLERRLAVLGRYLIVICLFLIAVIFVINVVRGHDALEVFLFSISLAVAAVPEGLPAVVTIALALGVRRMARRQALVRNLPAVETLGCVTVICSDKTGTLTRNEMTVREVWTLGGRFRVTGVGYAPEGEFERLTADAEDGKAEKAIPAADADLVRVLRICALCNNARVQRGKEGGWLVVGDPTEAALHVLAAKAGIDIEDAERLHEIPFDSERKAMSVVVREASGESLLYIKGAAETILDRCTQAQHDGGIIPLAAEDAKAIHGASLDMGRRALRVLALAWRPAEDVAAQQVEESDLIFAGLVGMIDPPRDEARPAIQRCKDAGVRPLMITGDHAETALAVARELELTDGDNTVLTGAELETLSDEQLAARIERVAVFARVSPEHKLRIVRSLRSHDHVAAMTGDGVNDAPALKAADIGVAMGRTGTDVTRSASDMVLLDDNFASIVAAVEEGRGIFDNIQKVTHYLLSCNAGELMLLFFAALVGWPAPLVAVQILWINLITDGVPALALGVEPPERDIMHRRPRHPKEPLISFVDALSILMHGLLIAGVAAAGFAWFSRRGASLDESRAATFAITAFAQLFFVIGCRSRRYTMPDIGWLSNPLLFWAIAASALLQLGVMSLPFTRALLKTERLPIGDWALVLILSLVPVTLVEVAKIARQAVKDRPR